MDSLRPEQEPGNLSGADNIQLTEAQKPAAKRRFIAFSLVGILMFLTPLYWSGKWTIGIGILADLLKSVVVDMLPLVAVCVVVTSAIVSSVVSLANPAFGRHPTMQRLFKVNWFWLLLRVLGAIFIVMIYSQKGPEWIISKFTGGVILNDLNPVLMPFFFFAIIMMPFLVDYGLMEYIGTLLRKPFQKIFRLPGRAAIDATASWLGAAPVGVLITSEQYRKGFYSMREASAIASSFSLASAAFCLLIVEFMGIGHLFVPFYLTTIVTGLIAAVVVPRLPPLSLKKDIYNRESGKQINENLPAGVSTHDWAVDRALHRAHAMPGFGKVFKDSLILLGDIYLGLMPVVFAIGTMALALSEYTPIFTWLSAPIVPYLQLLGVPEAAAAAPSMVVGFADMFLPAVLGKGIENEMTKFIIASMSVLQIIYMTEVGALILKAKIGLNLLELFAIFVIRTLICLPIVVLIAKLVVF